ncbi:MAG: DNA repair protein RecN, partial [bacterium]
MARPEVIVSLAIRGLGVIEDAEVDLGPGLTAITGETGAGKTMVLSGLALLLGERTDAGIVRVGHESALAEGRFDVPEDQRPAVEAILDDAGGAWDADGTLLVARTASAEGRSRAHLGGRSVPAGTLRSVGALLVAVHGQDDQHRLLHPAEQRKSLDRYAGGAMAEALAAYRECHAALLDIDRRLREITDHSRDRAREADELRDVLALIDDVRPQPGEDEALRRESDRLLHVDEIVQAVASAHAELVEREDLGASGLVAQARAALDRVAGRDPHLAGAGERLERLRTELDDVAVDLSRYLADLDADPARAAKVQERRAALAGLRRRLGRLVPEGVDVADWRTDAEARLAELDDDDRSVEELRQRRAKEARRAGELAMGLSGIRRSAAAELADRMTEELSALAMPSARLSVEVTRRTRPGDCVVEVDGQAAPADRHGIDDVEFLLSAR